MILKCVDPGESSLFCVSLGASSKISDLSRFNYCCCRACKAATALPALMPKTKSMNHSATDLPSSPGYCLPERFWMLLYLLYPFEAGCKLCCVRD